jgi:hypothetical protein
MTSSLPGHHIRHRLRWAIRRAIPYVPLVCTGSFRIPFVVQPLAQTAPGVFTVRLIGCSSLLRGFPTLAAARARRSWFPLYSLRADLTAFGRLLASWGNACTNPGMHIGIGRVFRKSVAQEQVFKVSGIEPLNVAQRCRRFVQMRKNSPIGKSFDRSTLSICKTAFGSSRFLSTGDSIVRARRG